MRVDGLGSSEASHADAALGGHLQIGQAVFMHDQSIAARAGGGAIAHDKDGIVRPPGGFGRRVNIVIIDRRIVEPHDHGAVTIVGQHRADRMAIPGIDDIVKAAGGGIPAIDGNTVVLPSSDRSQYVVSEGIGVAKRCIGVTVDAV